MDQYIDNRQKEIFWNLLANLADDGAAQLQTLQQLVNEHPQSAVLQALVVRANGGQFAGKAATYIAPRLLHKIVTDAQSLPLIDTDSVTDLTQIEKNEAEVQTQPEQTGVIDTVLVDPYEIDKAPQQEVTQQYRQAETGIEQAGPVIDSEPDTEKSSVVEEDQEAIADTTPENTVENEFVNKHCTEEQVEDGHEPELFVEQQVAEPAKPQGEMPGETEANITPDSPAINEYRFSPRFPKREAPVEQQPEQPKADEPIEDEVYDEIVSIDDIGFKPVMAVPDTDHATEHRFSEPAAETEQQDEQSPVLFHQPDGQIEPVQEVKDSDIHKEEEKLILGGIVGGDYLSFDKKLDELREIGGYVAPRFKPQEEEQKSQPAEEQKVPEQVQDSAKAEQSATGHTIDPNHVSRYDDDKMPYTFLWWLDKTRKEHAGNIRPYAETGLQQSAGSNLQNLKRADELQQQYFENIFSLTSVTGVERDTEQERPQFNPEKKEDVIIERFIQSDPQIKPLSADKLDNENKAKRSSEDSNEVVTETLARIYADQMLYHKAIATYKKLILKFPEKSTYFAARIEELEKKTN